MLDLRPATGEHIRTTFMKVEMPETPLGNSLTGEIGPQYQTIGGLYHFISWVLEYAKLPDHPPTDCQFAYDDGVYGPDLEVVKDFATAEKAIKLIIIQGEGAEGNTDHSHYYKFREMAKKWDNSAWDYVHLPDNPHTEEYKDDIKIYKLSRAFDATYCYLLKTIETLWTVSREKDSKKRTDLINNAMGPSMKKVMPKLAEFLVKQEIKEGPKKGTLAAPCFEYYSPEMVSENQLKDLKGDICRLIEEAKVLFADPAVVKELTSILDFAKILYPID
jgi:hypothetical protein